VNTCAACNEDMHVARLVRNPDVLGIADLGEPACAAMFERFGAIVTHKIRKFAPKDHLTKNDFAKLAECDGPLWRSCGARRSDQGANALYGFTFLWWR
jgi:hypothetical protein